MTLSDTTPAARAIADQIVTMLGARHEAGVHIADLINGAGAAYCTMIDSYVALNDAGRFLRKLAETYEADPLRAASASRARN